MNGIEKITERIKRDAQLEITAVAEETRAKCEEILSGYKEQADAAYWKIVTAGRQEAEHLVELRKGAAQTDSKKRMLQLKQEMVAEAFAKAEKKLLELPEAEYERFLIMLAVRASGSGDEKLVFSPADREKYGAKVVAAANEILASAGKKAELSLADESRAINGGLILSGGRIETNCSIKTLMELRRNELAPEVAKLLFE